MRAWRMALLLCALFPATAGAAPHLVGMEDERLLLDSPAEAPAAVAAWAAAGVDVVRIHARWSVIGPRVRGSTELEWEELDRAVDLVRASGMRVMLTVTGPGPLWTSRAPARRNPRYKPDPRAFGRFAGRVAERYGDRVDTYLIWNEPNIPGWLDPQLDCRRACTAVAPHLYRDLLAAAYAAIKRADPGAEVVMGELAPIGRAPRSARSTIPPLTFLRAMACLDERYRPMPRRGPCGRFRTVRADSVGHHPHGVQTGPGEASEDPRWAKIGDLPRLLRVLDRITARGRFRPTGGGRFHLHLTEFGYQTSPPDHAIGVTLAEQAQFLQQAAYVAWKTPRVRSLVHYQWLDEPVRFRAPGSLAYAGWQSGLHFVNGEPKPALASFRAPFVIDGDRFWGQVREGGAHRVRILENGVPVADAVTDSLGFWTQTVIARAGADYRFTWDPAQPPSTRAVRVTR